MSEKLTVNKIKRIIEEEKKKLKDQGVLKTPETVKDAWSGGNNLVNKIDYIKKLEIKEQKLRKKADIYAEYRKKLKRKIIEKL
jgi:hypothetical protein